MSAMDWLGEAQALPDWLGEAQALLEGLPPLEAAPRWDDPPSDEGGSYQGGHDSDGMGGGGTHRVWD